MMLVGIAKLILGSSTVAVLMFMSTPVAFAAGKIPPTVHKIVLVGPSDPPLYAITGRDAVLSEMLGRGPGAAVKNHDLDDSMHALNFHFGSEFSDVVAKRLQAAGYEVTKHPIARSTVNRLDSYSVVAGEGDAALDVIVVPIYGQGTFSGIYTLTVIAVARLVDIKTDKTIVEKRAAYAPPTADAGAKFGSPTGILAASDLAIQAMRSAEEPLAAQVFDGLLK